MNQMNVYVHGLDNMFNLNTFQLA